MLGSSAAPLLLFGGMNSNSRPSLLQLLLMGAGRQSRQIFDISLFLIMLDLNRNDSIPVTRTTSAATISTTITATTDTTTAPLNVGIPPVITG